MEKLQVPHCPVLSHLLTHQGHLQVPIGARLSIQRPIMFTFHLREHKRSQSTGAPLPMALLLQVGRCPLPWQ
jgi:hypothetical protein